MNEAPYGPLGELTVPESRRDFATKENLPLYADKIKEIKNRGGRLASVPWENSLTSNEPARCEKAGFDIIDVDHLVGSVAGYREELSPEQVFSGYCDPVGDVLYMADENDLYHLMQEQYNEAGGRLISSAGCEIPGETSEKAFRGFCRAAGKIV